MASILEYIGYEDTDGDGWYFDDATGLQPYDTATALATTAHDDAASAWSRVADTAESYAGKLPLISAIAAATSLSATVVAAGTGVAVIGGLFWLTGASPTAKNLSKNLDPSRLIKGLI